MRLRYALWLAHLQRGEALSYADVGRLVAERRGLDKPLVGQTVSGWTRRDVATDSRENNLALAGVLAVDESWLVEGVGATPDAELWARWQAARDMRPVKQVPDGAVVPVPKKKPAPKRHVR
jgi:hypothetical protein